MRWALDDTIVAISTPATGGARGIVRVSGPRALQIADTIFVTQLGPKPSRSDSHQVLAGRIALDQDNHLLPGEVLVCLTPKSYTREDLIEFHTTGATAVMSLLLARIIDLGARLAEPGEFTARAYYHGAMSLPDVEATSALIHARSNGQLRAARAWLSGRCAKELDVRQELEHITALVEAEIDFDEEGQNFITLDLLVAQLDAIIAQLERHAANPEANQRVHNVPRALFIGPINAGKSTLLNRMCSQSRAICSPFPGTTRDFLSAVASLRCGEIEIIDSAGFGKNEHQVTKNGKKFFVPELGNIDLVLHVIDLSDSAFEEQMIEVPDEFRTRLIWVCSKLDLVNESQIGATERELDALGINPRFVVSARTGAGIEALREALEERVFSSAEDIANQGLVVTARHRSAIERMMHGLQSARQHARASRAVADRAELIATDLRDSIHALGLIFGEVTSDDLLNRVFASFCIGK